MVNPLIEFGHLIQAPNIVGVVWDEDSGVVDLTNNKVLCYVYGKIEGEHWNIPVYYISDADFAVLDPNAIEDPDKWAELTNWANVCNLLNHKDCKVAPTTPAPNE